MKRNLKNEFQFVMPVAANFEQRKKIYKIFPGSKQGIVMPVAVFFSLIFFFNLKILTENFVLKLRNKTELVVMPVAVFFCIIVFFMKSKIKSRYFI